MILFKSVCRQINWQFSNFDSILFVFQIFSAMFFLMLITLGMGSAMGYSTLIVEVTSSYLPNVRNSFISATLLFVCFLFSMVYITPGGQHILQLVDYFTSNFVVTLLAIAEVIAGKHTYFDHLTENV